MTEGADIFNLSEIFVSIQGEGRYLGSPSIFVRSSGCNLHCRWENTLCDTPYASWEAERNPRCVAEIVRRVRELMQEHPHVRHAVLTGGEPLLQKALDQLAAELRGLGLFQTLETNGTIARELAVDFVSLSPKLASSTPRSSRFEAGHEKTRTNLDALRFWHQNYDCQFKFVVNQDPDEAEILELLAAVGGVAPEQVCLRPQGISAEQLAANGRLCVAIALRHGWTYTPRAQIGLFGARRGT